MTDIQAYLTAPPNHATFLTMKLVKAALNSLLCGLFFCGLLSLLFVDLNINSRLGLPFLGRLALILFITYGLITAALALFAFAAYTFFSSRKNIAFVSPTFLSLGFSVLSFVFLLVFHGNVKHFASFFDAAGRAVLHRQWMALLGLGLLGFLACAAYYRYHKRAAVFAAYFVLAAGLLGYAFSLRPEAPTPPAPRPPIRLETRNAGRKVTILELDGLSFDFIIPLISADKLPNFALLVEQGSWGRLDGFTPSDSFVLEAAFGTGQWPAHNRLVSPVSYRLGGSRTRLEVVPRFLFFGQLTRTGLLVEAPDRGPARPQDIWTILGQTRLPFLRRDDPGEADPARATARTETLFNLFYKNLEQEKRPSFGRVKQALARDSLYEEAASKDRAAASPQVFQLKLDGLTTVEQYFYRYSFPDLFGNVAPEDVSRFGSVIERYYQFYDQVIGKYLAGLKEDELLLVFSAHGMEPLPFWRRVMEGLAGDSEVSAFHEAGPEGAFFFFGKTVNREKNVEGLRIVDLAPTLLYYLGLPVGRDLDGVVRSSLFLREFTNDNPVFTISSYADYALVPGR
jgi:hypothetical protein